MSSTKEPAPGDGKAGIGELLAATNSGASVVRPLFTTFLLFTVYLVVIVASTNDEDLLKGTTVKLPLLDASISIVGFYVTAPFLLLVLHFWLLLHFALICENLHSLLRAVKGLAEPEYSLTRQRLDNFTMLHAIAHEQRGAFRALLVLVNGFVLAGIPIAALLLVQARFLPYHDVFVTWWHRLLVILDLALISYFWPVIMKGATYDVRAWGKRVGYSLIFGWNLAWMLGLYRAIRRRPVGKLEGGVATARWAMIATPLFVSLALFTFPYEGIDRVWYGPSAPQELPLASVSDQADSTRWAAVLRSATSVLYRSQIRVPYFPFVSRNISLPDTVLVKGKLEPSLSERLRRSDPSAIAAIEPLNLSERDLSFASLRGAVMPRADLSYAKLVGASLDGARLEAANFARADLSGAFMADAKIAGASFHYAKLVGAYLGNADARFAAFDWATAYLSDWSAVRAVGASFDNARLQGADFYDADLRGVTMSQADLSGASLSSAKLPSWDASLTRRAANLVRAVTPRLTLSEMRGIAKGDSERMDALAAARLMPDLARRLTAVNGKLAENQPARKAVLEWPCDGPRLDDGCDAPSDEARAARLVELVQTACLSDVVEAWNRFINEARQLAFFGQSHEGSQQGHRVRPQMPEALRTVKNEVQHELSNCLPPIVAQELSDRLFEDDGTLSDAHKIWRDKSLVASRFFYYYYSNKK